MTARTTAPPAPIKCKRCDHSEGRHTKHGCRGVRCSCSGWIAGAPIKPKAPTPARARKPADPNPKPPSTKRDPKTGETRTSRKSKMQLELERAQMAAKAARMRAARHNWDYIAQECGYASRGAAYSAVQRELKEIPREAVEELRTIELESLDKAEKALEAAVEKGNTYAVDSMLRIKAHRAKLTGLYESPKDTGLAEVQVALREFLADARASVTAANPEAAQ